MSNARNINNQKNNSGQQAQPQASSSWSLVDLIHVYTDYLAGGDSIARVTDVFESMRDDFLDEIEAGYPLCCKSAYMKETAMKRRGGSCKPKLVPHPTVEGRMLCRRCAAQMGLIDPVAGPQRSRRRAG